MIVMRDVFLGELFNLAKNDSSIMLLSADMGAPSLDQWRDELPAQFIATGIAEQNTINVAAGLSAAGKKVYVYFMASWAARCFEQIRYSCALGENPITIIGNGIGLGYSPGGPAHEPNEDIAYMRSILGIEVITPSNNKSTKELVHLTYNSSKLRYIRLERNHSEVIENLYTEDSGKLAIKNGFCVIESDLDSCEQESQFRNHVTILSCGFILGRAKKVIDMLKASNFSTRLIDVCKIKSLNSNLLDKMIIRRQGMDVSQTIVTIEEQTLSGGFGSAIYEMLLDNNAKIDTLRFGLPEKYLLQNASRDYLLDNNGLSDVEIFSKILEFDRQK